MKTSIGKKGSLLVLLLFFSLAGFVAVAGGEVRYTITPLGTLEGGTYSRAYDINDSGAIVGEGDFASSSATGLRGFFWKNETGMTNLGALGKNSSARGINNAGKVVGYSNSSSGPRVVFTWMETDPVMKEFTLSGPFSEGWQINDLDNIAGFGNNDEGNERGFRWAGTSKEDVGTLGGNLSQAYSINNAGNVVGFSMNSSGNARAFLWDGSIRELEILSGYLDSYANRINAQNQVVGKVIQYTVDSGGIYYFSNAQPFLWENGSMRGLGTLAGNDGEALDINDAGVVVGWSMVGEGSRAFIWDKNIASGMVDLNELIPEGSGWVLAAATAINNEGQIVGYGFQNGGSNEQAYLLTPVPQEDPEEAFEVRIDIRPWNSQNKIHLQARWGMIPIAIFSDADFNALKDVDRRSLTFGRTGEENSLAFCAPWKWDVNHDRKKDLICYFHERPTGFQCGDTVGTLKGKTLKGEAFGAQDKVQIVLCPPFRKHHHGK